MGLAWQNPLVIVDAAKSNYPYCGDFTMSEEKRNGVDPGESTDGESKAEETKAETKGEDGEKRAEEPRINETIRNEVERLQREIKGRDQIIEQRDKTLREYIASHRQAVQEFEAIKERLRRDVDVQVERSKGKFLAGLLEVLDNFDRSISAPPPEDAKGKALLDGVKMVREQFMQKLKENAVTRLEVVGQSFDPERHEAITTMPAPNPSKDGVVAFESRAGYMLGDKVLRPAQVVVYKG
jgi:molecular chaperone GrpE